MYVYIAFYICTIAVSAIFELGWRFYRWRFFDGVLTIAIFTMAFLTIAFSETHRNYTG